MTASVPRLQRRLFLDRPVAGAARRVGRVFIAWGAIAGRTHEIAAEVGAEVLSCFPPGSPNRPPALIRYARSAAMTTRYLIQRRPLVVIVTNPPVIPAVLATVYARLTGSAVVLDDHPGAFGAMGYKPGRYLDVLHRWAAKRARLCLVTDDSWSDVVGAWGGRGLVLHEAPGLSPTQADRPCGETPRVLFVCTFGRDEPVQAFFAAAALLADWRFDVTGDPSQRPPGEIPPNVRLVGFLGPEQYREALEQADVVIALTTEPTSAMRAAFEAVWMEKVIVVSGWPLLRRLFPDAVHVDNTVQGIAAGVSRAVRDHPDLAARSRIMKKAQYERWEEQLASLRSTLDEVCTR